MAPPPPAPLDTSHATFIWPPPDDMSDILAFHSESTESEIGPPAPPDARALPAVSDVRVVPASTHPSRVRVWRVAGRLVLVCAFVAISGSAFLGVNVARERRQLDVGRSARVLSARSIAEPIASLPMIDVERSESAALLRESKLQHAPLRMPQETHRLATVRPPRVVEPVRASPGWVAIELPIQVEIYEDGRFIATNAGDRITLTAGEHQLELVNESLRYRSKQMVSVLPGRFTPVRVALPSGILHVNALPWGDVTIDGKPAGQTPLGNLKLPIGPHQIVFRHPEFGEQTRTAVVTAAGAAHVTLDWRK